ncbi:hypothetical protein BEWA_029370 [Theileria equi strain WA]|uniref:Uncharacterized protein n=1 Tax=Theileria equi strain WA TaxID=1537102 RepID=L0AWW7_THEEQ|nr:hypothetical protein BEWA_029370 [Theileria equi strain WA]AFZ80087.1 hypothetical protein BEWA_029370 [Theileria equi strain WA]|eukprot:XP_004829753.1 hypothetical protein BEWA_029370 [Theileria equi strain WA]
MTRTDILLRDKNHKTNTGHDAKIDISVTEEQFGECYVKYTHKWVNGSAILGRMLCRNTLHFLKGYDPKDVESVSVYFWKDDVDLRNPLMLEVCPDGVLFTRPNSSNTWCMSTGNKLDTLDGQHKIFNGVDNIPARKYQRTARANTIPS